MMSLISFFFFLERSLGALIIVFHLSFPGVAESVGSGWAGLVSGWDEPPRRRQDPDTISRRRKGREGGRAAKKRAFDGLLTDCE